MAAMRTFVWLIVGFGLYQLAKLLEAFGDMESYAAGDVSWERLTFQAAALVVVLVGVACFVRGGILAYRAVRGIDAGSEPAALAEPASEEPDKPFDPDAALAHYLETRPSGPSHRHNRPRAPRLGQFGRGGAGGPRG